MPLKISYPFVYFLLFPHENNSGDKTWKQVSPKWSFLSMFPSGR